MSFIALYSILTGISVICLGLILFSVKLYFSNVRIEQRLRRLELEKKQRLQEKMPTKRKGKN